LHSPQVINNIFK
jgi:hypothetical protein